MNKASIDSGTSRPALCVLIVLAVASPWLFGGAVSWANRPISVIVALAALISVLLGVFRGGGSRPAIALWPFLGLLVLAGMQLVPLPEVFHSVLAPGSSKAWHPLDPHAAAVLGPGPYPISLDPHATSSWIARSFSLGVLALMASAALRQRGVASIAATIVTLSGFIVAVYGILARMTFGSLLYGRIPVPTVSPFGPFVNKNHFSGHVEMAALLSLGLALGLAGDLRRTPSWSSWMESRRSWKVLFAFGIGVVMVLSILASLSRGGVVSLSIGIVFLLALYLVPCRDRKNRLAVILAAVLALLIGASLLLPAEIGERLKSLADLATDGSTSFRMRAFLDSLRLTSMSPIFGHGFGAFADAFTLFKTYSIDVRVEHAENDYVELLAEGGVLAAVLLLTVVWIVFRRVFLCIRGQKDRLLRGIGSGALAAIVAILAHGLFDFNLRLPSNALLCAFCASIAISAGVSSWKPIKRSRMIVLSALLFIASVTILLPQPRRHVRDIDALHLVMNRTSVSVQRAALIEHELTARIRQRPAEAEAWVLLGWAISAQGHSSDGVQIARYGASLDPQRQSLSRIIDQWEDSSNVRRPALR